MTADRPINPSIDPEIAGVEEGLTEANAGLLIPLEDGEAWIDA